MLQCSKQLEDKLAVLSELEHNYEELQEKFKDKYGEGGEGDGINGSGNSNLMKIKNALRHMKQELSLLYLREGVIAQSVMECRIQKQNVIRKQQIKHYRDKSKGKSAKTQSNEEDEGLDLDD